MGVPHQSQLLEQFEGAVDGGDVDPGHRVADLLRGRVAELSHGSKHVIALRRHTQPVGVQLYGQIVGHLHHRR